MVCGVMLLLLLLTRVHGIQIVTTIPSSGVLVEEGGSVSLLCQADSRWFLCLWNSPLGNKVCAIQENDEGASQVCQGDPRIMVQGDSTTCGMTISNVTRDDWGAWMCLVQDGEEFLTDRREIGLEVGRRGRVVLDYDESNMTDSRRVLRMVEGSLTNISCSSDGAYPIPSITWPGILDIREGRYVAGLVENNGLYGNITVVEKVSGWCVNNNNILIFQGEYVFDEVLHLYSIRSSITYLANIDDNNSSISCYVQQSDLYGNIVYHTQETVYLVVDPAPPTLLPVSLSAQVGIMSGALLTIIFLVLGCVLVTMAMCSRQRKTMDTTSEEYQSYYARPVWTTSTSARPGDSHVYDRQDDSDTLENSHSVTCVDSYKQNTNRNNNCEKQRKLPIRNLEDHPVPPLYETDFSQAQSEDPVTLLHPRGLFLHPAEDRVRSISCIEQYNRNADNTDFPCCSLSR